MYVMYVYIFTKIYPVQIYDLIQNFEVKILLYIGLVWISKIGPMVQ
jgi:hypothetical protein